VEGLPRRSGTANSLADTRAADHVAALGVTGSPTKPLLGMLKMFGPIERSNGPSSAVLILDQ